METLLVILFGSLAGLVVVFVASGIRIVNQSEAVVIERLGRYQRTLHSGVNIIIPLLDRAKALQWQYQDVDAKGERVTRWVNTTRIDLRETVYDFPRQNVITSDNVLTQIDALIYFQITDPSRAVYEINNLPNAIEKLTQTTLRNVIGELDLDQTLTSRDTVNTKLRLILDEATDKWGVKVNRVELQDISPPVDIKEAMEKQMRAERDRRAMILDAEGRKQAAVLQAEGVRQAQISRAEGERQARILLAEGEAEARIHVANAEAEALRRISESFTGGKGDPANYLIALRYIQALQEMVSGQDNKVIYMPYEATGVISAVGGIREMLGGFKPAGE